MNARDEIRDPWANATWEGAEAATLAAGAALTLPERLRWLEQARRIALALAGDRGSEIHEDTDWGPAQGQASR